MQKELLAAPPSKELTGSRVEIEFGSGDSTVKSAGYFIQNLGVRPYKTHADGKASINQYSYGVVLDHPTLLEGFWVQVLVLTRLACAIKAEGDPFLALRQKGIYVQIYTTTRFSSLESLWLFEQLNDSPQESLDAYFDLWRPGRVALISRI